MKKFLLTSGAVLSLVGIIGVAHANIDAGSNSADCDSTTLGVESGPTNLEAQWQANTITLKWYDNGTQFTPGNNATAGTCTYDGALTVPSDTLTRTGYTFDGWTVRVVSASDLSALDPSITPTTYGYTYLNGDTGEKEALYGLTTGSGEWAMTLSSGIVYGTSTCSTTSGTTAWEWDENLEDNIYIRKPGNILASNALQSGQHSSDNSSGMQYCWCRVTDYAPSGSNKQSVGSSSWVFNIDYNTASNCTAHCADYCAYSAALSAVFRSALYGQVQ